MDETHASGRRGRAVSVEAAVAAGFMAPLHAHEAEEAVHVLEGGLTVYAGDATVALRSGETFVVPAGTAHTYRAEEGRTRAVFTTLTSSPGFYESFLRATGPVAPGDAWADEDEAVVTAVAAAAQTAVYGPPGALPAV
jgi:quercetin dioxygenase-like cupin family protein